MSLNNNIERRVGARQNSTMQAILAPVLCSIPAVLKILTSRFKVKVAVARSSGPEFLLSDGWRHSHKLLANLVETERFILSVGVIVQ